MKGLIFVGTKMEHMKMVASERAFAAKSTSALLPPGGTDDVLRRETLCHRHNCYEGGLLSSHYHFCHSFIVVGSIFAHDARMRQHL